MDRFVANGLPGPGSGDRQRGHLWVRQYSFLPPSGHTSGRSEKMEISEPGQNAFPTTGSWLWSRAIPSCSCGIACVVSGNCVRRRMIRMVRRRLPTGASRDMR